MAKLIFGCGYLGSRVANAWRDEGESVFTVTRSVPRAADFAADSFTPIVADVTEPTSLIKLPEVETVLWAVGFDRAAGPSMQQVYVDGLRNVLNALAEQTQRVLYISSTGVYGQTDGGWVDEGSPCRPTREGGRVSLAAERTLWDHPLGRRGVVLRLAGIYGPGRVPRIDNIVAGEPVPAARDGYLNLIHVADAVRAIVAAETLATPGETILVSDGRPPRRREFYQELARLLDAPAPRFVDPPASSPKAQRATSDKRVSNRRMLAQLRIKLAYPTFRQGLADIVAADK